MKRIELMELVRERQIGKVNRRDFLRQAGAVLGSAAAANTLLAACTPTAENTPPPVIDASQPPPEPGLSQTGELETGIVTYDGPEGELMGYLARVAEDMDKPAVIVIQEWWGLNEHIQDITRRFAEAGYVALAPDLYQGQVATEPDEARKLAMELSMGDAVAEIQAAMAYLRGQDYTTDQIGIIGFCMGGGLVWQTAAADDSLSAAVPFYGQPMGLSQVDQISAPVLSFLGTEDGISATAYESMHARLEQNGVPNHFQLYEGAQHSFFNDTRASYDADVAADAWDRTLSWFDEYLSPAT